MYNLIEIHLEARRPDRNLFRRYRLTVGRDLLGDWVLVAAFGRVGTAGQERRWAAADAAAIKAVLAERLARRRSAPRRLGCAYRLVRVDMWPGTVMADWVDPAAWGQFQAG